MSLVHIRITNEAVTQAQKKVLIAGVTALMQKTFGPFQKAVFVFIDEVELDDVGLGGLGVRDYRKMCATQEP